MQEVDLPSALICQIITVLVLFATCRKHCNQEQDWTLAAALLDEYSGWQLVTDLISGQKSAQECLVNPLVFGV